MLSTRRFFFAFGRLREVCLHRSSRAKSTAMSSNPRKFRLGVCQLNTGEDKEKNLSVGEQLIERGKEQQCQMIFFPEAFDYICPSKSLTIENAETIDGPIIQRYRSLAAKHRVWLSLGGFHQKMREETKISNTHLLIDERGEIVSQYKKVHLFDVQSGSNQFRESDFTEAGREIPLPVDTPIGRLALAICYDLRFPELSRLLTLSKEFGAEILTYPSAFTKVTGEAHWEVLLRARAIENQCFVVAAAQSGIHSNNRQSFGHSLVVDPWGQVLLDMGTDAPALATVEIDLDLIEQIKRKMPIEEHRRVDLYELTARNEPRAVAIDEAKDGNVQWGQIEVTPKQIFYRTTSSFATVNKKPVVPGHVLVSPLRRVERFEQLSRREMDDLFVTTQLVAKKIEEVFQGQSLTIAIQDGPFAGQTIRHVHVHILPRKKGDFADNDSIYDRLSNHDRREGHWRSEEEMAEEATMLRKHFYSK